MNPVTLPKMTAVLKHMPLIIHHHSSFIIKENIYFFIFRHDNEWDFFPGVWIQPAGGPQTVQKPAN